MSYLADCRYDASGIEAAFKDIFGAEIRIFNPISNDAKIAVTTTTARDLRPCIITNYNGGKRPTGISIWCRLPAFYRVALTSAEGYSLLRAEHLDFNLSVSEA